MIHSDYNFLHAFVGGALIGLASLIGLLASGKIPGISGVFSRLLVKPSADSGWRFLFLAGLVAGGALAFWLVDSASAYHRERSIPALAVAGLLVGFGTRLGGGCTSGHGICGIGVGSRSSILATVIFMASGIATVWAFHHLGTFAQP